MCFFPAIGVVCLLGVTCACTTSQNPTSSILGANIFPKVEQLPQALSSVETRSREITVRVITDHNAASGILIDRKDTTYFVITNQHVLHNYKEIKIGTFDDQLYLGTVVDSINFQGLDLALVSFNSSKLYAAARLGRSGDLMIGDWVVSTGFPMRSQNWKFADGQYSLDLPQPLKYGYSFGYSSAVEKGMSGGPVFDMYGRVVAVNGVHANPIWGKPTYRYANGEKPCEPMQEAMTELSWAIPMETVIQFMPHLRTTNLETVRDFGDHKANLFIGNQTIPNLLQTRAKLLKNCVVIIP